MAIPEPGCCDTEYELIRKILLGLPEIGGGGSGGPATTAKQLVNNASVVTADGDTLELTGGWTLNGDSILAGLVDLTSEVTGVLPVANGGTSTSNRTLTDSAAVVSVDWENRSLVDEAGVIAVRWTVAARELRNSGGTGTLDWQAETLSNSGTVRLRWSTSRLIDNGGVVSLYWATRDLYDAANLPSLNWDSRTLSDSAGTATLNWATANTLTLSDNVNIAVNTGTGTKIGTATGQKIGFWNNAPVIQPAAALQAAITNSTGGTQNGTLVDVATAGIADPVKINDNFTDIFALLDAIRTGLVNSGIIKGAA